VTDVDLSLKERMAFSLFIFLSIVEMEPILLGIEFRGARISAASVVQ
jgi:hypothetical protein